MVSRYPLGTDRYVKDKIFKKNLLYNVHEITMSMRKIKRLQ